MDISRYELDIKDHAYFRAVERGIDPDNIEYIIKNGKIKRFGKHGIKFICKSKKRIIICVGMIVGIKIKIFTVEEK